jgi:hypothetical protein
MLPAVGGLEQESEKKLRNEVELRNSNPSPSFVLKLSRLAVLLWQRVRESNPCTSLERAVS